MLDEQVNHLVGGKYCRNKLHEWQCRRWVNNPESLNPKSDVRKV
ncbi:MAG: hypothetical protein ACI9DJ_002828 [Algoriphagus sp.]|jgi:hypothetical protein